MSGSSDDYIYISCKHNPAHVWRPYVPRTLTSPPSPYMHSPCNELPAVTFDPDVPRGLTSLFGLLITGNCDKTALLRPVFHVYLKAAALGLNTTI